MLPATALLAQVQPTTKSAEKTTEPILVLEKVVAEKKLNDPINLLNNEPVDSIFGFKKSLQDTPRSISVLGDDMMLAYGIENALDVAKVVPSTYTTSIFGINGNVNIRGIPSDTYFRGMKRLENTQLFPSPITAMSRLEVVRGSPSPIYGPGKVGGYTNFVPKAARASTGKYLETPTGKTSVTYGSYNKKSAAFEVGGPFSLFEKRGGYYVYVNGEDSDTYWNNVPFRQAIFQSSFDLELTKTIRLEFGQMYQHWGGTELAGWNRITQELINTGMYNGGEVQVDMDRNGDGLISTAEVDSYGALIRNVAPGTSAAAAAAAVGQGWRVNPATASKVKLDRRANSQSPEDGGEANINLGYFDIVFEPEQGTTITNKIYAEYMERWKWTRASAFAQDTASFVFEEKLVFEKAFAPSLSWLDLNTSLAANWRYYDTFNRGGTKYSDLVNRADLSRPFSELNRFAVSYLEPHLAPWNTGLRSKYENAGLGALTDITLGSKINLILGGRADWINIHSRIPLHVLTTPGLDVRNNVDGRSWTASGSYEVFKGIRPYFTYARQKTLVIGIDGGIGIPVVPSALNGSELREAGLKTTLFEQKLMANVAAFRQTRTSFSFDTGQVLSTLSKGIEAELRWVPNRHLSVTGGATFQKTVYTPIRAATITVNPSFYGLSDADFYGGRYTTTLAGQVQYMERSGYPDKVFTVNATYLLDSGWAFNVSGSYQASIPSGRIKDVILPAASTCGASVVYTRKNWSYRLQVNNLTNELYFTPNSPDGTGEAIVIPAPERNMQGTLTYKF